ncbi:MAG: hypothetical protein IT258_02120 [Saprospiraceae bacterium]|nr:hypothetical protein [Saprospiraceae bacterium]
MTNACRYILPLSILFNCLNLASAQTQKLENKKSITVTQLLQKIQDSPSDTVRIFDVTITADPTTDARFLTDVRGEENWDSLAASYDTILVNKMVMLIDVHFAQSVVFPKIRFQQMLYLEKISVYGDLFFRGCAFDDIVNGHIMESYYFGFDRCDFRYGFRWEEMTSTHFSVENSQVQGEIFTLYNVDKKLMASLHNTFFGNVQTYIYSEKSGKVTIYKCRFDSQDPRANFLIGDNSIFSTIELIRDTFDMVADFNDLSIKELFQVNYCQFNQQVLMKGVNLPEGNTSLPWSQLAGNKLHQKYSRDSFFAGALPYETRHEAVYLDLLKNYSQLLRAYKNNGDSESYNACYTEMKDMVTRKAAFNFRQNANTSTFFTLYLNRFLKIFCDYGTNPVKALIFSMYVILTFGLLYFVFPSDGSALWQPPGWRLWQKTERQAWANELRNHLTMSKLRRGFVQLVNAVALSMNAFVTLGYGDMPARGVARYLAVLEGLMGWFLLSIFSASLISQILQ